MNKSFHVTVPQMGEGLQYAKVVRILKNVGDRVEEDGDVIEVETAKATLSISTPFAGVVSAVSCRPGDLVDIGATLLEISRDGHAAPAPSVQNFNQRRKGQESRAALAPVPVAAMPPAATTSLPRAAAAALPEKQLQLVHHMRASQQIVVPASIESRLLWDTIDGIKKASRREESGGGVPSGLEIICWAAAQAMQLFEKFRGRLSPDNRLEISAESIIGIAVADENDTIDTRVVALQAEGFPAARAKIRASLGGRPAAGGYHSLSLSDMSSFQVVRAQPVVVYPSAATLFIGTPYWGLTGKSETGRYANLVLAFDHRLMNGAYAARFLREIDLNIRRLAKQDSAGAAVVARFGAFGRAGVE